jgi:hypothetical protein
VPPWHELEHTTGIIGTPLLEHHARFVKSATYGERLTITSHIEEWRAKVFIHKHTVMRDDDLICESTETRVFCKRDAQDRRSTHQCGDIGVMRMGAARGFGRWRAIESSRHGPSRGVRASQSSGLACSLSRPNSAANAGPQDRWC